MNYETLGAFYLGKVFDHKKGDTRADPLLYNSKDLTTHAVCLGMTGSGKTGLGISLLEEAAIDGVPAIVIDPKGDMGNLKLTFPALRASDFQPWIDPADAAREGQTVAESANATASAWREGLAAWDQQPERIAKLRAAAEVCIYTPGSNTGHNLTVLRTFEPPPKTILEDSDAFRELVGGSAAGLLALLGLDADPLRSREHILISAILQRSWLLGESVAINDLIGAIQTPPFERIGALDIEQFYPKKDRSTLAMSLNALLASPSFAGWLEGEPLSIKKLLWTDEGTPRISIINIAHLSDSERMFFVTILLDEMVAWVRSQSGTSSLRALLYMDEIFGFFPPVANPPSKRPMLTLLKQARAHGLGIVLATQNPVDLDYKGLANTGTWFIGRMQTERDIARVVDGLEGAASTSGRIFDRSQMTSLIAGLAKRVFVMNNVHEDGPVSFKSRWALSFLRGPLSRDHIRVLTANQPAAVNTDLNLDSPADRSQPDESSSVKKPPATGTSSVGRPALDADIDQVFLAQKSTPPTGDCYHPELYAVAELHYVRAGMDVDEWKTVHIQTQLGDDARTNPWPDSTIALESPTFDDHPVHSDRFGELPAFATRPASYRSWSKKLKTHLYKTCALTLFKCTRLKLTSQIGETKADFLVRVREAAREKRDENVDRLREKYGKKLATLQNQMERAEARLEKEAMQLSQAKTNTAVSVGTTLLGALFGRKVASIGTVGRTGSTLRRASKISKESQDVTRAEEKIDVLQDRLSELESEFQNAIAATSDQSFADMYPVTTKNIAPRKSDIDISRLALSWAHR